MTENQTNSVERIEELNDQCRKGGGAIGGKWFTTPGIRDLPAEDQQAVIQKVITFDDFSQDNDPYGEHDFGSFTQNGNKIFWKIDYYDPTMQGGSEDPADPSKTTRVLTLMLAEEY